MSNEHTGQGIDAEDRIVRIDVQLRWKSQVHRDLSHRTRDREQPTHLSNVEMSQKLKAAWMVLHSLDEPLFETSDTFCPKTRQKIKRAAEHIQDVRDQLHVGMSMLDVILSNHTHVS